jgi:nitrogen fixation/metabolism regulation signal transduction histidine kinase
MVIRARGDLEKMTQDINTGHNVVIGSVLLAMILMILFGERVIKSVLNPISSLVEATKVISKGAFDETKPN